jgi:predicted metalloprotease with PDZ domain
MIRWSLSAVLAFCISGFVWSSFLSFAESVDGGMTEDRAYALAEEFGIDVGEVDEEIKEILGLNKAEGVVVFGVIGSSPADRAGIKVKAIIKEVDGQDIRNLLELGKALERALPTRNFSVATFEAAGIDDQGVGGGLNFHFVRVNQD